MTDAAHAIYAPSAMARTVACPGSVSMQARYPQDETPEGREGTAAHWVAACVRNNAPPPINSTAFNGETVTEDMINFGYSWLGEIIMWPDVNIESRVTIPHVHRDNWGTCDAWSYDPTAELLRVGEYKYGHKFVDAFENFQLIDYALGLLAEIRGADVSVEFVVYQPRNYHRDGPWRRWRVKATDLRPYYEKIHKAVSDAALAEPPTFVNPLCDNCSARHACGTLQQAAYATVEYAGIATPVDLPAPALGRELQAIQRAAALLAARATGLEAQALASARSGATVPGFRLQSSQGREKWKTDAPTTIATGAMLGVDLAKAPDVITPPQARERLKQAKLSATMLDQLSERPPGELKLVPDDLTQARKVFGK
jgi:hypothetical protein